MLGGSHGHRRQGLRNMGYGKGSEAEELMVLQPNSRTQYAVFGKQKGAKWAREKGKMGADECRGQ